MTDLLFETGSTNIGGSLLIRFAPVAAISQLPPPAPSGPSTPPTFRAGFRWYSCYGTEGTKPFDEEQSQSDNGPVWAVKVQAFLPGDSAGLRQALRELSRHRFVLELEDNVGLLRRIGTLIENLELTYSFTTGAAMGDRRGFKLVFSGSLSAPSPILTY